MATQATTGHSSTVRLYLRTNGSCHELAQVGAGRVFFDEPTLVPPGPAELVIEIDGDAQSHAVVINSHCEANRIATYVPA